jgi:hypothetical protein
MKKSYKGFGTLDRPKVYIGKSEITDRYQVRLKHSDGRRVSICSHYDYEDAKKVRSFLEKKVSRLQRDELELLYSNPNLFTLLKLKVELESMFNVDDVPVGILRTRSDGTQYPDFSPKGMLDAGAIWDEQNIWSRESTRAKFYEKWKSRS